MKRNDLRAPVLVLFAATVLLGCANQSDQSSDGPDGGGSALASGGLPVGSVIAFAGVGAPPNGWLLCDGQEVSRTEYAKLFAAISIGYGIGDGSTTFHVPDYRGRFLRGVDRGAGRDPDAAQREAQSFGGNEGDMVGTVQDQATALPNNNFEASLAGKHTHGYRYVTGQNHSWLLADWGGDFGYREDNTAEAGEHTHTITGGDPETRPKNVSVDYIIKAL